MSFPQHAYYVLAIGDANEINVSVGSLPIENWRVLWNWVNELVEITIVMRSNPRMDGPIFPQVITSTSKDGSLRLIKASVVIVVYMFARLHFNVPFIFVYLSITVMASDSTDSFAWFSNYGPCAHIIAPVRIMNSACIYTYTVRSTTLNAFEYTEHSYSINSIVYRG